jgi:hypothetical protein
MRQSKYTKEVLEPIVRGSLSIGQVLRRLGLKQTGGNHRQIVGRIRLAGISTAHFRGAAWCRGETVSTHPSVASAALRHTRSDEEVFVENSPMLGGVRLIKRLLRRGWQYACKECSLSTWRGEPLSLQLDHLNGVSNDNRLENLRLLCPNCHSQTETYCRKKVSIGRTR